MITKEAEVLIEDFSVDEFKPEDVPAIKALREELSLVSQPAEVMFPIMSVEEQRVIEVLFPYADRIRTYEGFIPKRVLEVLKAYKSVRKDFNIEDVYVWHSNGNLHDPYLIYGQQWWSKKVKLARWGSSLMDWNSMVAKAKEILIAKYNVNIPKVISNIQHAKDNLSECVDAYLKGIDSPLSRTYSINNP